MNTRVSMLVTLAMGVLTSDAAAQQVVRAEPSSGAHVMLTEVGAGGSPGIALDQVEDNGLPATLLQELGVKMAVPRVHHASPPLGTPRAAGGSPRRLPRRLDPVLIQGKMELDTGKENVVRVQTDSPQEALLAMHEGERVLRVHDVASALAKRREEASRGVSLFTEANAATGFLSAFLIIVLLLIFVMIAHGVHSKANAGVDQKSSLLSSSSTVDALKHRMERFQARLNEDKSPIEAQRSDIVISA